MSATLAPPTYAGVQAATRSELRSHAANLAALSPLFLVILADLAMIMVGIDDLDEGYFAEQATRVLRGEMPYRDFATFYTPGLLYVHAGLFALLGEPLILGPRLLALLGRAALAFGLYVLARSITAPRFAVLPGLFLLVGMDSAPVGWEPHPGWLSTFFAVVTILLVDRGAAAAESERKRWLFLAGTTIGMTFLFKQNTGVFIGMAATLFLGFQGWKSPAPPTSRGARWLRLLALVIVLAAFGWLMRPFMRYGVVPYLLVPLGVSLSLLLDRVVRREGESWWDTLAPSVPLALGFTTLTLPWLLPLLAALGGRVELLSVFMGSVNQVPLFWPLELPTGRVWGAIVLTGLAVWLVRVGSGAAGLTLGAVSVGAVFWAIDAAAVLGEHPISNMLQSPGRAGEGLVSLLPVAAAWAGIWLVRTSAPSRLAWRFRWYLVAGSFLMLTQYPRMDPAHLSWSSVVLLVIGAAGMGRLHHSLVERWQLGAWRSRGLYVTFLLIPAFAATPMLYQRAGAFWEDDLRTGLPVRKILAPLDVPHAQGLLVPESTARDIRGAVEYIRTHSEPNEPVFVYPTAPLLYVLADRPNASRFAHLYPGAASSEELDDLIANLERQAVRLVVLSEFWRYAWSYLGDGNAALEEYFWREYREVARFGGYRVMERLGPEQSNQAPTMDGQAE